ncbi:hypothetical protein MNBD_DELTA01-1024 [hydrothermal vent metagenome]|uniref:Restriction endonuclease type IV Mrr domain-containing protein n=1 Tax=hydrothermal vent metagenome TaxID=652676 RepID=A0A3B0QZJ3_9ZZZZ
MALLAEELVEEWLNRQGYFTISGIKLGVDEIDLLAIKTSEDGTVKCRHIEVQASINPISYLTSVSKEMQKQGRKLNSAKKRTKEELLKSVEEWVEKKFFKKRKVELKKQLSPKEWTTELVINIVKHDEEIEAIRSKGISVFYLKDIIRELKEEKFLVASASGADFVNLINMNVAVDED